MASSSPWLRPSSSDIDVHNIDIVIIIINLGGGGGGSAIYQSISNERTLRRGRRQPKHLLLSRSNGRMMTPDTPSPTPVVYVQYFRAPGTFNTSVLI